MCCVDTLKDNIIAVQTESANNEKTLNRATYPDIVLEIQSDIKGMNSSICELYEKLYSSFSSMTKEDYFQIESPYRKLIKSLVELYNSYRRSSFYSGVKTDLKTFKASIEDLQEMKNDMQVFIASIPQNNRYGKLIDEINSL